MSIDMNSTKAIDRQWTKIIWFVLSLMLFMAMLQLAACSDSHAKKLKKNFIRKGDEIHFTLNGESAYVPAAYFRGGSEDRLGILHYVKLWAILPDFEVYDKNKNHNEFYPTRGFGRRIDVKLISRAKRPAKINELIRTRVEDLKTTTLSGRLGRFDEYRNDLEIYRSKTYADDFYLYRENGTTVVYLHCSSKKQDVPYPSCMMLWDISDNIAAEAVFSLDYISEWKSVLVKVKELIHTN